MSEFRLAMVSRRFWPLVGGPEVYMGRMAEAFHDRGVHTTLLAAQVEPHWPTRLMHRDVSVIRLPGPPQPGWGTLRYMRSLGRWTIRNAARIDLAYVSMLKHDAYSVIGALQRRNIPVVVRAERSGEMGDCQWQNTARFGPRIRHRCQAARAIVAPTTEIQEELIDAGYDAGRVHTIPNGIRLEPPRNRQEQLQHRCALAQANQELRILDFAPLVVYTGRLHSIKRLDTLIDAFRPVAERWPEARLWLVGEGPERDQLAQQIFARDLQYQVVMPGTFDDVQSVLLAADLFVLPSKCEGISLSLLEAMAAGLPVIADDVPGNRQVVTHGKDGWLTSMDHTERLSQAIVQLLQDKEQAHDLGLEARKRIERHFLLDDRILDHLRLFDNLLNRR